MKQALLLAGLIAACVPTVQAVDLNKDAMKAMQQEGHQIIAESEGGNGRVYKTANGLCLDLANGALVVRKCNEKTNNQKWRFDDKNRLVAHNGKCVEGAQLKKCGGAAPQKWKLDGKKRLANNKLCLQTKGNPPKGGSKVTTATCGKAANQVWK